MHHFILTIYNFFILHSLSLEAQVFFLYGYTSSELDTVILAFKEKINHNRIRPTSLVQQRGEYKVEYSASEQPFDAKDWVPFKRVMPHAEYPSASGCICHGIADFMDEFLINEYGHNSIETTWAFENIDPVTFHNMTELYTMCGESRLWGGMHFTKSVPDSYELCNGVGRRAYTDLMVPLLNGGSYSELMDENKDKFVEDNNTATTTTATDVFTDETTETVVPSPSLLSMLLQFLSVLGN